MCLRIPLVTLLCSFCLLTCGCGASLNTSNFEKVKTGMTLEEVEDIMGAGKSISADDLQGELRGPHPIHTCDQWYKWGRGGKRGYIGFDQGKVRMKIMRDD